MGQKWFAGSGRPFCKSNLEPPLFMTPSTATPPEPASADFCSVAGPHRSGGYAFGPLGRKSHQLQDLDFRILGQFIASSGGSVFSDAGNLLTASLTYNF